MANEAKIPVFGSEIEQVKIGCLAAEGLDYVELGRQTGKMAAQVLKGEKKASAAENLGIEIPAELKDSAAESFTEISEK